MKANDGRGEEFIRVGAVPACCQGQQPVRDALVNIFSVLREIPSAKKRQPEIRSTLAGPGVHQSREELVS